MNILFLNFFIDALQDLVSKAVIDVRKLAFGDDSEDTKTIPWNGVQFWEIMKKLSKGEFVNIKYFILFIAKIR